MESVPESIDSLFSVRRHGPPPYRVAGELTGTDAVMARATWVGVYPGLTEAMRAFVAEEIRAFARGKRP